MNKISSLVKVASKLPVGNEKRRQALTMAAKHRFAFNKKALTEESSQFIDWVILNNSGDPISETAAAKFVSKVLGDISPTPYEKSDAPTKRGKELEVGDLVVPKPDKAPPINADIAEQFKYMPGTVQEVDTEGVIIKFQNGQIGRFYGKGTGAPTGLFRHTPKSEYSETSHKDVLIECVYFSQAGEVEPYRKHVVEEYVARGDVRNEDRKRPYYSGPVRGFKISKEGNVYFTVLAQQRPYPVSIVPKTGKLLYVGILGKRPNWKGDFDKDVEKMQEEGQ
jgi:hypothetical protein